jgi:adenine deaminase
LPNEVRLGLTADAGAAVGTSVPARFLKIKDLGTVEKGKFADLVLLDADPLQTIAKYPQGQRGRAEWSAAGPEETGRHAPPSLPQQIQRTRSPGRLTSDAAVPASLSAVARFRPRGDVAGSTSTAC